MSKYDLKLESEIKKLGFKKKHLTDYSGYWYEFKKKYKDLNLKFIIESDHKYFDMSIKSYEGSLTKLKNGRYDTVKLFKCNIKTIKEVIKNYK